MKDQHLAEIMHTIQHLDESQLLYILTFIRKIFGSR